MQGKERAVSLPELQLSANGKLKSFPKPPMFRDPSVTARTWHCLEKVVEPPLESALFHH